MEEEFKYKRLLDCMIDMWSAIRRGEDVSIKEYTKKYGVGCFPRRLLMDILTAKNCPTENDALEAVRRRRKYQAELKARREAIPSQLYLPLDSPVELTEEICIRFLKNTGNYIIKKKVVNVIYEDV